MKKWLALILAAAAIIVLSVVLINRNSILKHILESQISTVCQRATLGKTAYAIKDGRLIIKVSNLSCIMKNGSAKIDRISLSYKIGDLIDAFLEGKTPQGSLKMKSPDIKINLNQIDRKAGFGKNFSISAISGGRIKTVFKGEKVVIENIKSSGYTITAKLIYKKYRMPILYKTDNAMIRIGFKNLKSSDFAELLSLPSGLKLSMSGMLSYNLNSKKIYIRAAGNNMLLEPYLNIGLPFSVIISANTDKNRYEASFYLKKDTNEIKGKLTSDGKRFMIYSSGRLGSTLLGKSNKKLAKIFKRYRISGSATIRNLTISGKLDNWEKASIYAKGSASEASFRVTHNTPLFENAAGEFELKQGTLYLRKLSGRLGSSTISDAKITISKLFSKPVADMMIPVKLKLDRYSREFFKKLVIPKNFHPLLSYANRLSAKTIISIKNYPFKPFPFFPFKIIMKNVSITNLKKGLKLFSESANIKRETNIVDIKSKKIVFASGNYHGKTKLFARIFSDNPDKKELNIEGSIDTKSIEAIGLPDLPYKGAFRLSIGRETKIGFSGHIRIAAISGALLIKNGQYGGNIKIDSTSPLFSYRANLNIDKNIVNIHAAGKVASGNFRLKGKYDIKKQYWLAQLSASSIKLDEILKLIKHNHKQTNWGKGMLKIKLDNSSYKKIILPYITANFTFDKEFITSKNIKIRFLNALMGIDCTYGKNKPFIEGNFSYKGKNSRLILQEIGLGQIEASKIYITGAFLIYPKNSYSTNIKFSAYKGNIRHFPALAKLLNYLNLKNILTLNLANFSKKGLKYKKIGGEIVIKNGTVATVKPIVLAGKLDMMFQGRYKIKQKDINGIVGIKTFTLINKIVSKIPIVGWILTGKDKSFSIMTFSVKGKPKNPSITPLPIKSVGIGLLNIIKRSLTFPFEVIK